MALNDLFVWFTYVIMLLYLHMAYVWFNTFLGRKKESIYLGPPSKDKLPKVLHFPFCFHSKNNFYVLTGTCNMCAEFYTRIIIAGGNIIWKAILWSTRRGEKSTKEPCVISTFLRSAT